MVKPTKVACNTEGGNKGVKEELNTSFLTRNDGPLTMSTILTSTQIFPHIKAIPATIIQQARIHVVIKDKEGRSNAEKNNLRLRLMLLAGLSYGGEENSVRRTIKHKSTAKYTGWDDQS